MARSLLTTQINKLISELEMDRQHYIRCAEEIHKKQIVLRQALKIADPKNWNQTLDGKVIERKKRVPKFGKPLDGLLAQVLKNNATTYLSTHRIVQEVLALDRKNIQVERNSPYTQSILRALNRLTLQNTVLKNSSKNMHHWKLNL